LKPTFWYYLSVPSSRVKLSQKKGKEVSALKMGEIGCPETPVSIHLTLHNNPEYGKIPGTVTEFCQSVLYVQHSALFYNY
jgi:hypothetical protein